MRLHLESPIQLADETECKLLDVVIDSEQRVVTHLVVSLAHREHLARLVPIGDIQTDPSEALTITHSRADFERYPYVESSTFVRIDEPIVVEDGWELGIERVLTLPSYSSDFPEMGMPFDTFVEVAYDVIPEHTVELRKESVVYLDGGDRCGHVEGFVIAGEGKVTHVVLQRGHLWGKRDITIPVESIKRIGLDEVHLRLTQDEVDRLPHVPVVRD